MDLVWQHVLTVAYGIMGGVSFVGYLPQMWAFWKNPMLCVNSPMTTWALWSVQTVVFFLYAVLVNGDPMFMGTTGAFMVATLLCFGLQLYGRWFAKHRMVDRRVQRMELPRERP